MASCQSGWRRPRPKYKSYLCRFPEQKLATAILHNAYPVVREVDPERIAQVIAKTYL